MDQGQKDEILNSAAQDIAQRPPETDEEEQVVQGLAQSELAGRIKQAAETYNLAQDLEPELLTSLGKEVFEGFSDDDKSRTEWLEKHAFWLSLYMQNDYAKTSDPERSWGATESVPILTEAANQFQSRTYKSFFPNDTFVSAIPMRRTPEDRKKLEDRADRIGRHMSYQLGFQDRGFKQHKDALFLGVAVHGSFFTKTYFDQKTKRFRVDNVRPTDLVVNYTVGPCRIEDLRRKTHVIYSTVGETEDLVASKFLIEPARACTTKINETYNIVVDDVSGRTDGNNTIKRDRPAVLLEQHGYFDLGDGSYHPYIATVCAASQRVLRLTIGYSADPQGNPLDDYKQVQYFTHYKYQENPDGFYGLGLGHSIGDINSAVNIALRQTLDAATLANDGNMSGFISERLGIEGDEIRATLGKFRKIPDTVGDFKDSIMMLEFPGPSVALIQLMEAMDTRAQRLGAVTEATTGSIDTVQQPTTVLAQIEQALEQFSSTQMRLANSFSEELQKIYKINQRYLPLVESFVVNGTPETITRQDYADDMLIEPIFDPKYATQSQKVARAQAELQATMQNPINQTRPMVIDEAFRRYFKALDVDDIDALIPPQPMVENLDDQYMENAFFLMPKEARPLFDVFPEQNHMEHLAKLEELKGEIQALGVQLQPDQIEDLLKHEQKHQGYLYGQLKGVIPTGQEPTPPLQSRQSDQVGNYPTTGEIPAPTAELLSQIVAGAAPDSGQSGSAGVPQQPAQ